MTDRVVGAVFFAVAIMLIFALGPLLLGFIKGGGGGGVRGCTKTKCLIYNMNTHAPGAKIGLFETFINRSVRS